MVIVQIVRVRSLVLLNYFLCIPVHRHTSGDVRFACLRVVNELHTFLVIRLFASSCRVAVKLD
jgi:hypothetical protein